MASDFVAFEPLTAGDFTESSSDGSQVQYVGRQTSRGGRVPQRSNAATPGDVFELDLTDEFGNEAANGDDGDHLQEDVNRARKLFKSFQKSFRSKFESSSVGADPLLSKDEGAEQYTLNEEIDKALDNPDLTEATLNEIAEALGGWENFVPNLARMLEGIRGQQLPSCHVRFRNLSVKATTADAGSAGIPTLWHAFSSIFSGCFRKKEAFEVNMLSDLTGSIKPGSLTLLLGRPASGKSSLMKALSGKLEVNKKITKTGEIDYNGIPLEELGDRLAVTCGYVTQRDIHAPTLTVGETLQFAHECLNGDDILVKPGPGGSKLKDEKLEHAINLLRVLLKHRPALILKLLGLDHAKNTVVGNAMLRGVSGGERKRVTTGEVIVGRNRVLLMDEISTGLDSAATFDIVSAMKTTTQYLDLTIVIALLQPPPEVFELFDNLILMDSGHIVYQGPRTEAIPYFRSLGYHLPAHKDAADFLVEVMSNGRNRYLVHSEDKQTLPPPMNTLDFVDRYKNSEYYNIMRTEAFSELDGDADFIFNRPAFALNWAKNLGVVFRRQMTLIMRNKFFLLLRAVMVVFTGVLYGTVFRNADKSIPQILVGALFASLMFVSMGQASQIANFVEMRSVFYKQRAMQMLRSSNYVISASLGQLPFALAEALVYGNLIYWLVGFSSQWNAFLYFLLILIIMNMVMTQYFFLISTAMRDLTVMQPVTFISILFFVLFAGFTITKSLIPDGWIWVYYISPIQWGITSLAINEYKTDELQVCEYNGVNYCEQLGMNAGDVFLTRLAFPTDSNLLWISIIVLVAFYLLFILLSIIFLEKVHYTPAVAVSKPEPDVPPVGKHPVLASAPSFQDQLKSFHRMQSSGAGAQSTAFQPAILAFQNLWYTVKVKNSDNKFDEIDLLKGVSGVMLPGTMTALMGSSGAGKTTLMDVIAYRKTSGVIRGEILINGYAADQITIRRATGYCEQMDIHSPKTTVREALIFSARLRQDASATDEEKMNAVQEAIDLLELENIADVLVKGLSVEQQKRLTIGVELVANPSILFLDEPTSGLDARAAKIIMRGVRKIANSGRTIVCTIHQPSSDIFFMFDKLLLLKRGGETVYFGDVGDNGRPLVNYLEAIPGTTPMVDGHNPATYMLEVIGAGVGNVVKTDFAAVWRESTLAEHLDSVLKTDGVGKPSADLPKLKYKNKRAAGPSIQMSEIFHRVIRLHWRSPEYNLARIMTGIFLGLIFFSTYRGTNFATYQGSLSGVGMIFLTLLFVAMTMNNSVLPVQFNERQAYYRERASQTYNALWWWFAMTIVEVPYIFGSTLIFLAIFYPGVGFTGAETFFFYWLIFSLYCWVMIIFGQMLIGLLPNIGVASIITALVSIVLNLFAGFNPPLAQIPSYWKWFYYITPSRYALSGLVALVFGKCSDSSDLGCQKLCEFNTAQECPNIQPLEIDGTVRYDYTLSELMSNLYNMNYDDRWNYAGGLFVFVIVYGFISLLAYRYINHTVR